MPAEPYLRKLPIGGIVAPIAIVFFCAAVALAIVNYPPPFSPLENWMSDLGNPRLNPSGAAYFNGACMIAGLFLVVFYLSLRSLQGTGRVRPGTLTAARTAGIFSGIALAGVGLLPETYEPHHFIVSVLFFVSSTLAILLATVALRAHPGFGKASVLAGYLTVIIGVVFAFQMILFPAITIIEWISVFSMLLWTALISIEMLRPGSRQPLYQS